MMAVVLQKEKESHLEAVRGLAAGVVVLSHFLAAFYPTAAFGSAYRRHASWEPWIATTPLCLPFAAQVAVCLFFILSGYVLSRGFLGNQSRKSVDILAAFIKRPFRLVPLVLLSEVASWLLARHSLFFSNPASALTFSTPWFEHVLPGGPIPIRRFLFNLVVQPFEAGANYNPPLWTIRIELYGSFLTYIFVLLFRNSKWRYACAGVAYFWFWDQYYQGFIVGIVCADLAQCGLINRLKLAKSKILAPSFIFLGLLLGSYPALVPRAELHGTFYAGFPNIGGSPSILGLAGQYSMLGAVLIFLGLQCSQSPEKWLRSPPLVFLGRISYPLYAIHFLLLGSLSAYLFIVIYTTLNYHACVAVATSVSLAILLPLSYLLARFVDEPCTIIANNIAARWRKSLQPPHDQA